jgi:hypothetical protein
MITGTIYSHKFASKSNCLSIKTYSDTTDTEIKKVNLNSEHKNSAEPSEAIQ